MNRKTTLAAASLLLVSAGVGGVLAGETKAPSGTTSKAPKMEHMKLSITGATAANRGEIEKCAREEGAHQASLNVQTGELKISVPQGSTFKREAFEKKLGEKLPGVTVKI